MPTDLTIRCSCGTLQGTAHGVSGARGNRAVCYCDDCQAFAHFLQRPQEILDAHGGSDVFQMSPARLAFNTGIDRLACMRLSPKGMFRWYASCCNTPIGNTLTTAKWPFVGLVTSCLEKSADEAQLTAALGPVRARVNRKSARNPPVALPDGTDSMAFVVFRVVGLLASWKLRGDQRRSPFFDPATGNPVVVPRVLEKSERDELRRATHA